MNRVHRMNKQQKYYFLNRGGGGENTASSRIEVVLETFTRCNIPEIASEYRVTVRDIYIWRASFIESIIKKGCSINRKITDNYDILHGMVQVLMQMKQYAVCESIIKLVTTRSQQTVFEYKCLAEIELLLHNNVKLCYENMDKSLSLCKNDDDKLQILKYAVSMTKGYIYYVKIVSLLKMKKDFVQAHIYSDKALLQFPKNGLILHMKALVYYDEGKYDEAKEYALKSIHFAKDHPTLYHTLANIHKNLSDPLSEATFLLKSIIFGNKDESIIKRYNEICGSIMSRMGDINTSLSLSGQFKESLSLLMEKDPVNHKLYVEKKFYSTSKTCIYNDTSKANIYLDYMLRRPEDIFDCGFFYIGSCRYMSLFPVHFPARMHSTKEVIQFINNYDNIDLNQQDVKYIYGDLDHRGVIEDSKKYIANCREMFKNTKTVVIEITTRKYLIKDNMIYNNFYYNRNKKK